MAVTGKIIKEIRKKVHMSTNDLADASGVSSTIIWKVETGKSDIMCKTLWKLIQAMGYQVVLRPKDKPVNEKRGEERYIW